MQYLNVHAVRYCVAAQHMIYMHAQSNLKRISRTIAMESDDKQLLTSPLCCGCVFFFAQLRFFFTVAFFFQTNQFSLRLQKFISASNCMLLCPSDKPEMKIKVFFIISSLFIVDIRENTLFSGEKKPSILKISRKRRKKSTMQFVLRLP